MMNARIALIGYPAEYFLPFARGLQQVGFEVFLIHGHFVPRLLHLGLNPVKLPRDKPEGDLGLAVLG